MGMHKRECKCNIHTVNALDETYDTYVKLQSKNISYENHNNKIKRQQNFIEADDIFKCTYFLSLRCS